jgi:hypothetical protein
MNPDLQSDPDRDQTDERNRGVHVGVNVTLRPFELGVIDALSSETSPLNIP